MKRVQFFLLWLFGFGTPETKQLSDCCSADTYHARIEYQNPENTEKALRCINCGKRCSVK